MSDDVGEVTGIPVTVARYILIKQTGAVTRPLFVGEVEVYAGGQNVALHKEVTASDYSTWDQEHNSYPASGITNGNFNRDGGNGYASNVDTNDNWLMVDLGGLYRVDRVKLYALNSVPTAQYYSEDLANIAHVDVFASTQPISGMSMEQLTADNNIAVRLGGTGAAPAYSTTLTFGAATATDDATPTIWVTLTAPLLPGETVVFYGNGEALDGNVAPSQDGRVWGFTPTADLVPGSYSFSAKVQKADGTVLMASNAAGLEIVAPTTAAPTQTAAITAVADDFGVATTANLPQTQSTDDTTLGLTGTLSAALNPHEVVAVYDGETRLGEATVTDMGWTFTTPVLAAGSRHLQAVVENTVSGLQGPSNAQDGFVANVTGIAVTSLVDDAGAVVGPVTTTTARYILVKQTASSTPNRFDLGELEVFADGQNVAWYKSVTVDTAGGANNPASGATDGDYRLDDHSYSTPASTTSNWLMVDLESNYALESVKLYGLLFGDSGQIVTANLDVFASTQPISGLTYAQLMAGESGAIRVGGTGARPSSYIATLTPPAATDDPTPTITGTLAAALLDGEQVVVYHGEQRLGVASVVGLDWSFTPETALATGTGISHHSFSAGVEIASTSGPGERLMNSPVFNADLVL